MVTKAKQDRFAGHGTEFSGAPLHQKTATRPWKVGSGTQILCSSSALELVLGFSLNLLSMASLKK